MEGCKCGVYGQSGHNSKGVNLTKKGVNLNFPIFKFKFLFGDKILQFDVVSSNTHVPMDVAFILIFSHGCSF